MRVRGNHDRGIAETPRAEMDATDAFAADRIAPDDIAWLGALPETATIGGDVFLCHGTPTSDSTYWLEESSDPDGIVSPRPRADMAREAEGSTAGLMLCGHSHVPRLVRLDDGRLILNPGSVGRPGFGGAGSRHRIETGPPLRELRLGGARRRRPGPSPSAASPTTMPPPPTARPKTAWTTGPWRFAPAGFPGDTPGAPRYRGWRRKPRRRSRMTDPADLDRRRLGHLQPAGLGDGRRDGAPMAEASSGAGMNTLARDGFEPALLDLVGPWLRPDGVTTIIACGMVGARQGWIEAPYVATPCAPLHAEAMVRAPAADPRLSVHIIPGVSQAAPPDVMRGEETQIAGFLAGRPRFDGVLCLPGTHTKWVHVSAGEIVSFATFMTGEVFALLAGSSVLRHSVGSDEWSEADFAEAVEDAMARPEKFASRLFGLRAASLLENLRPERARARLSGLLIGLELAGSKPLLAGPRGRPDRRRRAWRGPTASGLALSGLEAEPQDAEAMTLAGLVAARFSVRA